LGRYENYRCLVHKLILYFKIVNNHVPEHLSKLLPQTVEYSSAGLLNLSVFVRTEKFKKSFFPSATMYGIQFVACHLLIYSKKLLLIFLTFHVIVIIVIFEDILQLLYTHVCV
jgi:hypothetical protein